MNYLADTHILIWILSGSDSLSQKAKQIVLDENNAIYYRHAHMIGNLKYDLKAAPHEHRDPFDRLLLAQAKVENYLFLTHDQLMPYYNENCIVSV